MKSLMLLLLVLFSFLFQLQYTDGLIHELEIKQDNRHLFDIETFGFVAGGRMDVSVRDFKINRRALDKSPSKVGFILRKAVSEYAAKEDLDHAMEVTNEAAMHASSSCILDNPKPGDIVLDMTGKSEGALSQDVNQHADGLYSFIFARCLPPGKHYSVDFHLHADFHNPGPDYLSAGDAPLPLLYFCFFCLFSCAFLLWARLLSNTSYYKKSASPSPSSSSASLLRSEKTSNTSSTQGRNLHIMMGALLLIKTICLLVESIRYHYIQTTGSSQTWNIIYYIITTLRGSMLFTVILLIGSGWTLIKAFLTDREKKIIIVVFTLQVANNVAMAVLEETAPGSQMWLAWRDALHALDIICCCAILFPIVASIQHLRQAVEVKHKGQASQAKLQLFRQFYGIVVAYIYFTRIAVFLIEATIPYDFLWLGNFFTEFATFVFYAITGANFGPTSSEWLYKDDESCDETSDSNDEELQMTSVHGRDIRR